MRTRISRYKILKQLHSGATADLLLGSYEVDGERRYAALKLIRSEHAQDQRFLQKFLGEVRLTIALGHKHLVEVHDVLGADGDYVVAMEYVHGTDLRTLLATAAQRGAYVPVDHVCAIASAVAAGLHHAHELRDDNARSLGVVHRNVSPSNILIGYDGSVKLGDFGTSKASMQRGDDAADVVGRTSYFSPEQCKRAELDRRSDVYSLGVVLYELATTARLFVGDSDEQVMDRIVGGDVAPPHTLRPELPRELSAIILRAIAVDPADRYATAGELRAALDQLAGRGKRAPASSLAAYVHKHVGEPPAPCLVEAVEPPPAFLTGNTWIEPPRDGFGTEDVSRIVARPSYAVSTVAPAGTEARADSTLERSSFAQPPLAPTAPAAVAVRGGARPARLAMIGAPLVALAGVGVWFALAGGQAAPKLAAAPAPAAVPPAPAPSVEPTAAVAVRDPAPVAAVDDGAAHKVASAEPSTQHLARIPEPTGRASKPHSAPSAPKRISTGKTVETAPAAAPAPPPVAAPTPPPAPPSPVVVTAPAVALPQVAAARPASAAPPAAPVVMAQVITPQALDANRIAGTKDISPDGTTLLAIKQAHRDKVTAAFKLCVNAEGAVSTIAPLQSTGFEAFDAKIESTIRDKWRYRPFLMDGRRSPVCTKFSFVYWPPVL